MADFCKQCADDMRFPESDFKGYLSYHNITLGPNEGLMMLCEGCGPAFIVDDQGTCAALNCDHCHGETLRQDVNIVAGVVEKFSLFAPLRRWWRATFGG